MHPELSNAIHEWALNRLLSQARLTDFVDPVPAVYLLYKNDDLIYIGQSSNLRARLADHARTKGHDKFEWYHEPDLVSRIKTESVLILALSPTLNRALNLGLDKGRVWEIRWKNAKAPRNTRKAKKNRPRTP